MTSKFGKTQNKNINFEEILRNNAGKKLKKQNFINLGICEDDWTEFRKYMQKKNIVCDKSLFY